MKKLEEKITMIQKKTYGDEEFCDALRAAGFPVYGIEATFESFYVVQVGKILIPLFEEEYMRYRSRYAVMKDIKWALKMEA